jgi:hypothetical protein
MAETRERRAWDAAVSVVVLLAVWGLLLYYYKPSLLLQDTMIAGGDTPSFLRPVHHLKDVLLPAGNPQGWDLGNFAGYPPYQFYFLPPALTIVALSYVMPFNVAFKLVSVLGIFLLPLTTLLAMRALRFRFPLPALGAAASLLFLFNEKNSMWGGNIKSTLAGEFAFSISFALAVLFVGLLWRCMERQRGWRSAAVVLALAGLCHPIGFLNGGSAGVFFLFRRREAARSVRMLVLVYVPAVLLMSFWLIPLMAKIGYATAINWPWIFSSVWEAFPPILMPAFVLAALDAIWVLARWREEDRPIRYLLVLLAVTLVWYLNATEIGLPEIRFIPFAYMLCVLLALDFLGRVLPLQVAPHVAGLALSAVIIAWAQSYVVEFPNWIRWNYSGLEAKPSWRLLQAITNAVHGTIHDPRVVYENSPQHDRFGSMRVFENMALLSGRATLEGVLLQTAVNSPFIYNIQSLVSKQGTGVIGGYPYPDMSIVRATPRLELYNVHDIIALTKEVKGELDKHPRWERTFDQQGYAVYHLKDGDTHYVRVPRFRPQLVQTTRWKQDFHRWFRTDTAIDVPIVDAAAVPPSERHRFPDALAPSPTQPPHEPVPGAADCRIDERIDHEDIDFTTTCPGLPHVVSVAYYPNWHVEGASHVFLVSPALMLVFPDGPHVHLSYRRLPVDWFGLALTALGLVLCFGTRQRRPLAEPEGAWARAAVAAHPVVLGVLLVAVLGATGVDAARAHLPQVFYQRAWTAFNANDFASAERLFQRAAALGGDTGTAADATFFRGHALARGGHPDAAIAQYQELITRFPDSIWWIESHYQIGLCLRQLGRRADAARAFQEVVERWPTSRWARDSAQRLKEMQAEPGGLG